MRVLRRTAGVAGLVVGISLATAACGSSGPKTSSSPAAASDAPTTTAVPASTTTAPRAHTTTRPASSLPLAQAQRILRAVVNPATPSAQLPSLVATTDTKVLSGLVAFAKAASAGGYTTSVFTVRSIHGTGDQATATVDVKSPHAPQPVAISYGYRKAGGIWKLSAAAANSLIAMTKGPQ